MRNEVNCDSYIPGIDDYAMADSPLGTAAIPGIC
jgi:hypothetical protein